MGVLKAKDPTTGVWLDIAGGAGAQGDVGPTGPAGPTGPTGPTGPDANEVFIGPDAPDPTADPDVDLWYDPDATLTLGTVPFPTGGTTGQALAKTSATDGDVSWQGPHLLLSGGTVTGDLTVDGDAEVTGALTVPTVNGDVNFAANISAESVEDRTAYAWEAWDVNPHFAPNWGNGDFQNGQFPGPAAVYRNRYAVIIMISAHIDPGSWQEDVWMDVINPGSLPAHLRPQYDLWQTTQSVETDEAGSTFESRVTNTGSIQVQMKGSSLDWQDDSRISINYTFPRAV